MDKNTIFHNNKSRIRKSYSKTHKNINFSKNKFNNCLNNSSQSRKKIASSLKAIKKTNQQKKYFNQISKEIIMKTEKNNNINNKNIRKIRIIKNKREKNRNKNRQNNLYIMQSFGDNPIEINKPKESNNYYFKNCEKKDKKINSSASCCNNNLNMLTGIDENNIENEIKNKILKYNISEYYYPKIRRRTDKIKLVKDKNGKSNFLKNNKVNEKKGEENLLDNFARKSYNTMNINELNRSYLSKYNSVKNNLDINLSSDDKFSNYKISFYFNHFINQNIEKIEEEENHIINDFLIDNNFENENLTNNKIEQDNKIDDFIIFPCMNCGKMINIDEIDEHSSNCFKKKVKSKNKVSNNNMYYLIEMKLKNIYEYLINENKKINSNDINNINNNDNLDLNEYFNFILTMKKNVEQILDLKCINQLSKEKITQINNNLNELMEQFNKSNNFYTLLNIVKMLFQEKINYLKISEKNEDNIKFRNKIIIDINSKNKDLNTEDSIEGLKTESETIECFDLKKMEKILEQKREYKENKLESFINETKNKRLFLMEVLKIKYQRINNDKIVNLITPTMIWEEAVKKKIGMNKWTNFIYEELNNPYKYLKLTQREKNVNKED